MTIDPTGRRNYMMYDSAGRKIADIDADGSVTEYRYDGNDNLTSTTRYANKMNLGTLVDAWGNPTEGSYSQLRPAAHADDQWTFQVYDSAQRLIQTIDGTGATTVLGYDGASRLISTRSYANRIDAGTMATLKAEAGAPNFWPNPTNGLAWPAYNLTATASGTIDGVAATKFSVTAPAQWEAFTSNALTTNAGDVLSFTISMKGVGSIATNDFGIYGSATGWGASNAEGYAVIASGPGTLTQLAAGLYRISGLSTTEATRVTVTRTFLQNDTTAVYFYVSHSNWPAVTAGEFDDRGRACLRSGPHHHGRPAVGRRRQGPNHPQLPRQGRAGDRHAGRRRRPQPGRLRQGGAQDPGVRLRKGGRFQPLGERHPGAASGERRDQRLRPPHRLCLRRARLPALHAERDCAAGQDRGRQCRPGDSHGRLIPARSRPPRPTRWPMSKPRSSRTASPPMQRSGSPARSTTVPAGPLSESMSVGAVTAFAYDAVGNVIKQTRYATLYATTEDPSVATMQSWAAGQAGNSLNRISRIVYDQFGRVAYAVDAENYVSETQYDRAGRVIKEIRYAGTYAVSDGVTKASLAALIGALPGSAVVISHSYDADGLRSETVDGTGAVTRFAYDSLGQLTDTTVAYGTAEASTTHRAYDAVGRVVGETLAYGTGMRRDHRHRL